MLRLSLLGLGLALVGWVRPAAPTDAKPVQDVKAALDYLLVEVQGEPKVVRAGEELALVAGDAFVVREAVLKDKALRPAEVNVLGFAHKQHGVPAGEDRGQSVDTAKDLSPRWSEGGKGEVYAIAATTGRALHGTAYVRLLPPLLRHAELTVNGEPRVMRDGEPLTLARADKLKVTRVVTNLADDRGVVFQIVELEPPSRFEIRFLRAGKPFASIPLKVTD